MGIVPCGFPEGRGLIFCPVQKGAPKPPAVFGRTVKGSTPFLLCRGSTSFRGETMMKKKIDIAAIPELNTSVGMHGSAKQKEVGGPLCLGIVFAAIILI